MIALIQRVSEASVAVDGKVVGEIGRGLLVLLAVQPDDSDKTAARLAERVLTYRVFPDENDRMNRSMLDEGLEMLAVPQFTLAADTGKGTRPSFTRAAPPELGHQLFDRFVAECGKTLPTVATGVFGANMQVRLVNDGPVTFWLEA
jgi:D-tyrosyl-tRNA(Tyr) deacylase